MIYPIQLVKLKNGLSLYIPNPEKVKSTYEHLLDKDPKTPFPFWAKLWASSKALTQYLFEHPELVRGKKVIEIGAGIGQPSFAIAAICKEIVISDHNKDAVELITKNIHHLGCNNATAMCLDWNVFPESIKADVILLSDINYAPEQFEPLLKLILQYILDGSEIIIATPQRIMASSFIEKIESNIKHSITTSVNEEDKTVAISIYILGR
jgi:predicted nicotinamide N-methyase